MPIAVRDALVAVMEKEGSLSREDAEARLAKMEKDGRYQQETW
jgi:sulfite reductase alpha subunit-like flavoprotein